jgi:hypothetical protein
VLWSFVLIIIKCYIIPYKQEAAEALQNNEQVNLGFLFSNKTKKNSALQHVKVKGMRKRKAPLAKYNYSRLCLACLALVWTLYCLLGIHLAKRKSASGNDQSNDECLRDSGFISEQHVSHIAMQIMSMPQFATHPTGFASR